MATEIDPPSGLAGSQTSDRGPAVGSVSDLAGGSLPAALKPAKTRGTSRRLLPSRPRILPVLILAAVTTAGLRVVDFVRLDNVDALLSGQVLDLGPGRPLMAQDDVGQPDGDMPDQAQSTGPQSNAEPSGNAEFDMASAEPGDGIGETGMDAMSPSDDAMDDQPPLMTAEEALAEMEEQDSIFGGDDLTEGEIDLLMSLSQRRQSLDTRESELDSRQALLSAAEMRIDEKVAELDRARAEIEDLIGKLDEAEEMRLARLVQVYEIMKPAEAAKIFDGLERDVLLQVMERMSERKLAPIMAGMNPVLARELTADLALRRRLPDLPEG